MFSSFRPSLSSRAHRAFFILIVVPVLLALSCRPVQHAGRAEVIVAAASDLTNAFEEIAREFEKATNTKVIFNFGSSGLLAKQIENGAPIDLFAAANVDFISQLEQKGLIVPGTKQVYARGRLIIWTSRESSVKIEKLADLTQPDVKRIAIANPEHAPYGMAARQTLETVQLWDTLKPKLVYAENIRQALQFAQTGNVEVALVALSLAPQNDGRWILVPEELHKPIDQGLGVVKGAKSEAAARAFADFIVGDQGQAVMKRYGFTRPE